MLISRRAVDDYLDRDFDNFTWMKKLTREIILRELSGLRVKPRFKTDSWLHQLVCFYIAMCQPEFLFLLDMGLGKTKIIADIITQRLRERRISRALIGVPRVINIDSWDEDLLRHSDLEPSLCNVSSIEEKRERLLYPARGTEVTVIDYAGLALAVSRKEKYKKGHRWVRDDKLMARLQKVYNFCALDESHKLSNSENLWFSVMRMVTKQMDYCYATTGTLFGKDVEDLWSQFYLVDRGETFGENKALFRKALFLKETNQWKGEVYTYNKRNDDLLHAMLQHRSIRYDEDEVPELDVPKLAGPYSKYCVMADEQKEHYLRAVEGLINAGGVLSELDGQWTRMRQIVSGYLAWKDEHGDHFLPFKQNPKMDLLESMIDEMGDSKVVVCCDYTHTGRLITERLKAMGLGYEWLYGGTKDKTACRRRFMEDPACKVFVMNSEAGGTGNDGLQKVARYMIFYETPPPPITRKQTIKRIHRPGQRERAFVYDLVMKRSPDAGILQSLAEGIDLYDAVVNGRKRLGRNFFLQ